MFGDLLAYVGPFVPSNAELVAAVPIIISLIILEGLLSVDNAMVLAGMVNHLPGKQRDHALWYGMAGAYLFRGVLLFGAAWLMRYPVLNLIGGLYLIKLSFDELGIADEGEEEAETERHARGFWATVILVEIMDLVFSMDNVLAAVALSPKLWVVCTGVFIGIAVMRFASAICTRLIDRFPVLQTVAMVLVGAIGTQLVVQYSTGFHTDEVQKFSIIAAIITFGFVYDYVPGVKFVLNRPFNWIGRGMSNVTELVDWALEPVTIPLGCAKKYAIIAAVKLWNLVVRAFRR